MYKNYKPAYNGTTSGPQAQLNTLLERIEGLYKEENLNRLIFLADMSINSFGESMLRLKLPQPTINDHFASTIYEKLLTVKNKNR